MAPPEKGVRGGAAWEPIVEMGPLGRASRSPGLEQQVTSVVPLSQPHLYASATGLFIVILWQRSHDEPQQRGVSTFTLSAEVSTAMSDPFTEGKRMPDEQ